MSDDTEYYVVDERQRIVRKGPYTDDRQAKAEADRMTSSSPEPRCNSSRTRPPSDGPTRTALKSLMPEATDDAH